MNGNKTECGYLCRDKDHPSFIFSIAQNENQYEKYAGVCTASCEFTRSVHCPKVTEEEISKCCATDLKLTDCTIYKLRTYGYI